MRLANRILLYFICIIGFYHADAQHVSINAGPWNQGATWNLGSIPTSASGTVVVNHAVNIPSGYSVAIDQVTVNATLTVNAGGTITLADGTGVDLTMAAGSSLIVSGEFIRNNLSTINQDGASTASFGAASVYRHRYLTTEGAPPLATWNATSNFHVEGFNSTSIVDITNSAWNQSFGNFTYNCTGQRAIVSFNGLITTIQGNLSFLSTGTNLTRLTDNEVNVPIAIAGNLNISGTSRVTFSEDGTGSSITLGGNFNHTSTSTLGTYLTNTGSFTLNVSGNFIMNGTATGRLFFAGSGGGTGTSTINLLQNFTLTSGTISESGSGTANGNIRFTGNGNFNFINTGTILNRINYYIAPTVTLNLSTYGIAAGANSAFVLDGGTIIVGSLEPTGAIRNSATLGNIRTTFGLRVFNTGSTIIYRSAAAQIMGDGQPTVAGVTTIIDNSQGVTLYQGTTGAITIAGTLQLEDGTLFLGARTLNLNGTVNYNTGAFGGNSSSVLAIGGTTGGSVGTLIFDPTRNTLGTLTLNRTGVGGAVTVNSTLTFASQLNLTNGTLNNTSGLTAGNGATVTRYPTAFLLGNALAHAGGESYNITYRTASTTGTSVTFSPGLEMPNAATDGNALNDLILLTAQNADILNLAANISVNGSLTLNRGFLQNNSFNITSRGDWIDNAGNFSPGTGSVIFDGVSTISGSTSPQLGSIQLNSSRVLTLGRLINISGNIDFQSGSIFTHANLAINLNGATLQTISANGAEFFNLNVAKTGGSDVQLTSVMNLVSLLRFNTPTVNCDFQSNGFLTLISTSDSEGSVSAPGTAQIYRLASGNTVTGDVTVQRYMSGEGRIYRYLSSPVTNATVASWKDDFLITGTYTDPSTTGGAMVCGRPVDPVSPSMYYYDETAPGNVDAGYVPYPSTGLASANPLVVGRGYTPFIRACNVPTVVDVTGNINQGLITFNITYTNNGDPTADGYNLIGNPYPCTVDWDGGFVKTRISPVITVRDNGNDGVMLYWDGTAGALTNGQLAPGQAFWVRATGANPILRITESAKVITPNASAEFFRETPVVVSHLALSLSNGIVKDRAFIKLRTESVNTLDDWDAPKLNNEVFDLYTVSDDDIPMAINSRNTIDRAYVVHLGIQDVENGDYTLGLDEMTGEFSNYGYVLVDNYTQQAMAFKKEYKFNVNDNPLSSSKDRFIIKLGEKGEVADVSNDEGVVYPNPVERYLYINSPDATPESISIVDNVGKVKVLKARRLKDSIEVDLESYSSGIYYVNLRKNGSNRVYKVVKK